MIFGETCASLPFIGHVHNNRVVNGGQYYCGGQGTTALRISSAGFYRRPRITAMSSGECLCQVIEPLRSPHGWWGTVFVHLFFFTDVHSIFILVLMWQSYLSLYITSREPEPILSGTTHHCSDSLAHTFMKNRCAYVWFPHPHTQCFPDVPSTKTLS